MMAPNQFWILIFLVCAALCTSSAQDDLRCPTQCSINGNCTEVDINSQCNTVSGQCDCNTGYYRAAPCDNCTKSIGSSCFSSKDCESRDPNSRCVGFTCQCKDSFYLDSTTHLCTVGLGSNCSRTSDCDDRLENAVCSEGTCSCKSGHFVFFGNCDPIIGSYCDSDDNCQSRGEPRSFCSDMNQCYCLPGLYSDRDGDFLCTESFGTGCSNDTECRERNRNIADENAVCTKDKCGCGDASHRAPLDNIYQCATLEFGMQCIVGQICVKLDENSACVDGKCGCDEEKGWALHNNSYCYYKVPLGDKCYPTSERNRCATEHAACVPDSSIDLQYRCLCAEGYISLRLENGTTVCADQLSAGDAPECRICIANKGRCYDLEGDGAFSGCQCQTTRSGSLCETIHTRVTCTKDEMTVCYEPHAGVDLSTGVMYAEGYSQDGRCRALQDDSCGVGNYKLSLPIGNFTGGPICGVTRIEDSVSSYKYQTRILVQNKRHVQDENDRVFDVHCRFVTFIRGDTGIGIGGWPGEGEGEDKVPRLTMFVRNPLNEIIPRGVALKIGDKIKLDLFLYDETDTYDGIKVTSCLGSNQPVLPHPDAVVLPLVENGCPAAGQEHITVENNFKRVGGEPNHLQTGLFGVFRLSRGTALFLHCQMEVCLEESLCKPATCQSRENAEDDVTMETGDTSGTSVSLVGEILLYDPETAGDSGLTQIQTIVVGVACGAAVIAIVVAAVLGARLRRQNLQQDRETMIKPGIDPPVHYRPHVANPVYGLQEPHVPNPVYGLQERYSSEVLASDRYFR